MDATIRRFGLTLFTSAFVDSVAASPLAHLEDPYFVQSEMARYSSAKSFSLDELDSFRIGNAKSGAIPFNGQLDDFMVFDK